MDDETLLTRRQLAPFLTQKGYPISYSTLQKYCSPAINTGPPVEGYWGRRPLHKGSKSLEWARKRFRPVAAAAVDPQD
jgi:hypothetical protein